MAENFRAGFTGATLMLVMDAFNPSQAEQASFDSNTKLEVRFIAIKNIIFVAIKYPGEKPCDAPFTPHYFDPKPFEISPPAPNMGFTLNYSLRPSGKTRLLGLGHDFSVALYDAIIAAYKQPFDKSAYMRDINDVYSVYSPKQLWDMMPNNQRYVSGAKDDPYEPETIPDDITLAELVRERAEYIADAGAICVYCVLESMRGRAKDNPDNYLVPIPIGYLRDNGFKVEGGIVYVDAPYDGETGLDIDEKYYNE